MNGNSSVDFLCMHCMAMKNSEGICPICGFSESNYQPAPHHLPLRTILNGKYLIGRVLGEGGFGITYLGWDLNLDLKIAIKEYYPAGFVTRESTATNTVHPYTGEKGQFFQNGREKFVDEAIRLAKFYALPGIVSIKEFFLENSTAYIVMEYIEGQTFKQYLQSMGGKIPSAQMFEMMKPLLKSLSDIHKSGIIHRDISPDNIMITKEGYIKLLDFGAARDFADSGNKSLSVMLKPGYAPEEQYRSRGVQGPWTDIYALCATIYKAITGMTPDESNERLLNDQLKWPSLLGIAIHPRQEAALMKGMSVLVQNRYQNINELSEALYQENYQERVNPLPVFKNQPLMSKEPYSTTNINGVEDREACDSLKKHTGNTFGYMGNGSHVVQYDDWVFFSPIWGDGTYRMKKDGSHKKQISKRLCFHMSIVDDWLYYCDFERDFKLCKMKLDGTDNKVIDNSHCGFTYVVDDWIYYQIENEGIYKIKTDGSEKTQILTSEELVEVCAETIADFYVYDNWIYYHKYSGNQEWQLYRMTIEGSQNTCIFAYGVSWINIVDAWIYYIKNSDDFIYRAKLDGSEITKINQERCIDLNVAGDWIYFKIENQQEEYQVYKIKTDGSGRTALDIFTNELIQLVDDHYFNIGD